MGIRVLAIETSCDDTSMGIICSDGEKFWVDELRAASSVADHQQYGGVVPEIASRKHSEDIVPLTEAIGYDVIADMDAIAVTTYPGLPGSLLVGKTMASMLGQWYDLPVVPVHHIHGHLFSLLLDRAYSDLPTPWVVLSVSGGHNDLYLIQRAGETQGDQFHSDINQYDKVGDYLIYKLGGTLDDASGEAFDKVARMLGGPYPGGPWISEQAQQRESSQHHIGGVALESSYHFPRVFLGGEKHRWNFSFSGLKGQCHRYVEGIETLTQEQVQEISYEFQEAVVEVLAKKLVKAGRVYGAQTLGIVGGVSANHRLWEYAEEYLSHQKIPGVQLLKPTSMQYCTDNAAMIGVVGLMELL